MLIAFLALIAMCDSILMGLGELLEWGLNSTVRTNEPVDISWSLAGLFGTLFWPLAWVMGIDYRECFTAADLLGTKMVANELIAYSDMGVVLRGMESATFNPSLDPFLSERSTLILTYALCGFSNFGAIGIQLGGIGSLAPDRRTDLAKLGLRAMIGGMLACCMTACIAGMLFGIPEAIMAWIG